MMPKRTPKEIAEECRALATEYAQQYGESIFAARIASLCAELAEHVGTRAAALDRVTSAARALAAELDSDDFVNDEHEQLRSALRDLDALAG